MDCVAPIPDRDLVNLQASHTTSYGLQTWARGRKPTRSASEVSIPDRDYQLLRLLKAFPIVAHNNSIPEGCEIFACLPMLNLIKAVLASTRWCQPSSTETEIRCDQCLHLFDIHTVEVGVIPYLTLCGATNTSIRPTLSRLFEDTSHHSQNLNGGSATWFIPSSWNSLICVLTHLSSLLQLSVSQSRSRRLDSVSSMNSSNLIYFHSDFARLSQSW